MIKEFVLAWDANKEKLSEYIASHTQEECADYERIVNMLFEQVINPWFEENKPDDYVFDIENIHEIDDGDYQGTLLYMIPMKTYQPSYWQYVATYVYYGSCSGCDTLQAIHAMNWNYDDDDENFPNKDQVKEYVDLCLEILQHCKYPFNYEED